VLDLQQRTAVPGTPTVWVFRDDRRTTAFYAIGGPHVALDDRGRPHLGLTVYGRQDAGGFRARGALLSLTTSLAVSATDRGRANDMARAILARERALVPGEEPPTPEWLAAEWIAGRVDVSLTESFRLQGTPSLTGDNQCVWSVNLAAGPAGQFIDAWRNGLPGAKIRYGMRARAAGGPVRLSSPSRGETPAAGRSPDGDEPPDEPSQASAAGNLGSRGVEGGVAVVLLAPLLASRLDIGPLLTTTTL
jgi:hypothetical protein